GRRVRGAGRGGRRCGRRAGRRPHRAAIVRPGGGGAHADRAGAGGGRREPHAGGEPARDERPHAAPQAEQPGQGARRGLSRRRPRRAACGGKRVRRERQNLPPAIVPAGCGPGGDWAGGGASSPSISQSGTTSYRSISPLRRVRSRGWNGPCPGRRAAAPAFFGSRHSRRGAMLRGLIGPSTVVARLKEGLDLSSASVKWIAHRVANATNATGAGFDAALGDRKSTRLNSSHVKISY